jgi:small subunit ribosomal protein S1
MNVKEVKIQEVSSDIVEETTATPSKKTSKKEVKVEEKKVAKKAGSKTTAKKTTTAKTKKTESKTVKATKKTTKKVEEKPKKATAKKSTKKVKAEEVKAEVVEEVVEKPTVEVVKAEAAKVEDVIIAEEEPKVEAKPVVKPVINYLSKDILAIKTIAADESGLYEENDVEEVSSDTEALYENTFLNISEGEICVGTVVNIADKDVFIDIGFKSEGIVGRSEFETMPEVGDEVDVYIHKLEDRKGRFILSKEKADFQKRWNEVKTSYENGDVIKGLITRRIKGGMVVDIGKINAFLPGSQIDVRPVTDFDEHVGIEYEFKIVKFNELRKNIVLSRKELLETDLKQKRQEIVGQLEVGMVLEGVVKNLTDFGAFVDLCGIDGLLHITDITWGRINNPSEVLTIGETITVKVIDFNIDTTRVSLGMKQLEPEPWEDAEAKYEVGKDVSGTVVNMMNYGIFLELEKGVEGLIHVSEMSWTRHIKHPNELFKVGDAVDARVLSIDLDAKKLSLGIKQLTDNPWDTIEDKYSVDTIHKGIVRNLTQFGAFVELEEGIDGLVHISDMSWIKNVRHPKEIVKRGDQIDVKVLEVSAESHRLALGIKQVEEDPWPTIKTEYASGKTVQGEVILVLEKGIIFKLNNDLEGIVPLKHVSKQERNSKKEQYKPGMVCDVTVQEIDIEARKVILMMDWSDVDSSGASDKPSRPRRKTTSNKQKIKNESTSDKLEMPQEILDMLSGKKTEE